MADQADENLRTAVKAAIEALEEAQMQHHRMQKNSYHLTQANLHLRNALLWLHAKDLLVI